MSSQSDIHDDFWPLVDAACDGTLLEPQAEELGALLTSDSKACKAFVDHIYLTRNIRSLARAEQVFKQSLAAVQASSLPHSPSYVTVANTSPSTFGYLSSGWPMAYLVAMLIVGVGVTIAAITQVSAPKTIANRLPWTTREPRTVVAQPEIVGRITGMIDCHWEDPPKAPRLNAHTLLGQTYALTAGLMEITYDTGSKVVLQGPVTYEVESNNGGFLSIGKLTGKVTCETARGLTIRTPTTTVTDLGTEFGVEVSDTKAVFVHVFNGSIKLQTRSGRKTSKTVRMTEPESARIGPDGDVAMTKDAALASTHFVRSEHLQTINDQRSQERFGRWKTYSDRIRRDPAVVAYYDFQRHDDAPNALTAVSNTLASLPHGAIRGAVWTAGRMPGKQALRFDGDRARVVVDLPQRMTQMTLVASVAIEFITDDAEIDSSGLLMADGWAGGTDSQEKCHWQIVRAGAMCLSTVTGGRKMTPPILPWQDWGAKRWRHLAVVADPAHRRLAMYLDGKSVLSEVLSEGFGANFGSAQIGNWMPAKNHMPRAFCGRMDELLILSRAMTADEIREAFEIGNR